MKHASIWMETTLHPAFPRFSDSDSTEIAVIGGGIAGLSCAYFLQHAGKTVTVLEADRIVEGVTGHTTAHITSEHNLFYADFIQQHGKGKAFLYADANQTAIDLIEEIVQREKISCEFSRVPQYLYTEQEEDNEKITEELAAAHSLELPVRRADPSELPFPVLSALVYENQAQFHPRKYCLALAQLLVERGGKIFEHSRVTQITGSDPFQVHCNDSKLTAQQVIVATHFPILDRGGYFARMRQERSYVIACKVREKLPRHMWDDTEDPYHYLRTLQTDEGQLLLVGGSDHKTGERSDTERCYAEIESYARSHFQVAEVVNRWSTQDVYPFDTIPFIGKYLPGSSNLFVATGFQGYGMTHGTLAGKILTDLILGEKNKWAEVFSPQRYSMEEGWEGLKEGLSIGKHLVGDRITAQEKKQLDSLAPGKGMVIKNGSQPIGVYKSLDGHLQSVSAVCTHLGCTLSFNEAETSWDCPCHGSRFSLQGEVLHGPAVRPLETVSENLD